MKALLYVHNNPPIEKKVIRVPGSAIVRIGIIQKSYAEPVFHLTVNGVGVIASVGDSRTRLIGAEWGIDWIIDRIVCNDAVLLQYPVSATHSISAFVFGNSDLAKVGNPVKCHGCHDCFEGRLVKPRPIIIMLK